MPFGEDIYVGVGGRTGDTGQKYASTQDDVRQKFTGYQKDGETSLDFAEARMYENRFGRFTAVDPLLASGNSANPQTFNRYVYVGNSPTSKVDPSGMIEWVVDKNAPKDIKRHTWISHEVFVAGGYTEWTRRVYTTSSGEVVLDPSGPRTDEGGVYEGWSLNGIIQGTGAYRGAGAFPWTTNG
jgi:RHS repeat-associated protein